MVKDRRRNANRERYPCEKNGVFRQRHRTRLQRRGVSESTIKFSEYFDFISAQLCSEYFFLDYCRIFRFRQRHLVGVFAPFHDRTKESALLSFPDHSNRLGQFGSCRPAPPRPVAHHRHKENVHERIDQIEAEQCQRIQRLVTKGRGISERNGARREQVQIFRFLVL